MSVILRLIESNVKFLTRKTPNYQITFLSTLPGDELRHDEEFRVLNLRKIKAQPRIKRRQQKHEPIPPRSKQMSVDQDWGAVWPGPRTFHPATVPLPIRQGFPQKGKTSPSKFANAELMKIQNFLHLTPPVIKKQCEALKKFCTEWPKGLETEEKCKKHFPIEIISSDYCHGLPTIRNPLARIVTLKVKLSTLPLDKHAKDKFLRLVGERYDPETDILTIVTDRCPLKKQNYDYAHYLLTAVFHESWVEEPWEATKTEADMETYYWYRNKSKISSESIVNWGKSEQEKVTVPERFGDSVEKLINEGENDYNISNYKQEVLSLLGLPVMETKVE